jgi:ATP-dependent Clp protease ATP-binding subunit ClpA
VFSCGDVLPRYIRDAAPARERPRIAGAGTLQGMDRQTISPARIAQLRQLPEYLSNQILGQDHVIPRVAAALQRGELGLSAATRPRGSFLFLGPTGVGKTELTIAFTNYLLGNERLFRFDMSEYQTQDSLAVLIGGRVGEVGLLGLARSKSAVGTLLFDEIEKAHPCVLDLFLQILDAARVTMASGETLDLSGFYVVFTSNIAASEILNLQHSSFATMERHVLAKAQQSLRPELYARIGEKLVFNRLTYDVQMKIARLHIARELAFLREKGFDLFADESVVSFLMQRGFHPRLGARPLRDTIERHLRGVIAEAALADGTSQSAQFIVCANQLLLRSRE